MSRPLRIEYEGALFHITSRGNAKQDIFLDDGDRTDFLNILAKTISRTAWVCHAYCLMSNHYHLLIETPNANLSSGMRQLNGVYTQAFNVKHGRVGHLFQGRFKSILVEKDLYLMALCRYIVLNPVRAGIVENPDEWKWSSYRPTAGLEKIPEWLHTSWILGCFDQDKERAEPFYSQFVLDGIRWDFSLEKEVKQQIYLGSEDFITRMQEKAEGKDLSEIPKEQIKSPQKDLSYFEKTYKDRNLAIVKAYLSGLFTLGQVASYFGLHYSTVSRIVKKAELDQ